MVVKHYAQPIDKTGPIFHIMHRFQSFKFRKNMYLQKNSVRVVESGLKNTIVDHLRGQRDGFVARRPSGNDVLNSGSRKIQAVSLALYSNNLPACTPECNKNNKTFWHGKISCCDDSEPGTTKQKESKQQRTQQAITHWLARNQRRIASLLSDLPPDHQTTRPPDHQTSRKGSYVTVGDRERL